MWKTSRVSYILSAHLFILAIDMTGVMWGQVGLACILINENVPSNVQVQADIPFSILLTASQIVKRKAMGLG